MTILHYLLLGFVLGVPSAWVYARWQWPEYQDDPAWVIMTTGTVLFAVTTLYPLVAGVGVLAGLLWLFVQTAKPGRIRMPSSRRERMQRRIDQLEAELDMREKT